jgi:hypothetical protein
MLIHSLIFQGDSRLELAPPAAPEGGGLSRGALPVSYKQQTLPTKA